MSAKPTFTVQPRSDSGKGVARKLRQKGLIPAVVYGHNAESAGVTADPSELYKLLTGPRRTNIVFQLDIEGAQSHADVMVRDYQIDPIRQELLHADFVSIDPNSTVTVTVPVTTHGRAAGVRAGGRLQMVRAEVPVTSRPADIPVEIAYDVTEMKLDSTLLASELDLPTGVAPAFKVDYAVARIPVPRGAEQMTADEEADAAIAAAASAASAEAAGEAPPEAAPED